MKPEQVNQSAERLSCFGQCSGFCGAVELLQKLGEHLIVKTVSLCLRMINCFAESRLKLLR
jgi:hypothetical protein